MRRSYQNKIKYTWSKNTDVVFDKTIKLANHGWFLVHISRIRVHRSFSERLRLTVGFGVPTTHVCVPRKYRSLHARFRTLEVNAPFKYQSLRKGYV